jgi:hypothetical protein
MLNAIFSISTHKRRNYTGMIRRLLAFGAAGVAAAMTVLPAVAWYGGLGLGYGCGCGYGYSLAGWWGPILGCPWGLFGGPFCW